MQDLLNVPKSIKHTLTFSDLKARNGTGPIRALNLQNLLEVKPTAYVMGSSTVAKYLSEVLEFVMLSFTPNHLLDRDEPPV